MDHAAVDPGRFPKARPNLMPEHYPCHLKHTHILAVWGHTIDSIFTVIDRKYRVRERKRERERERNREREKERKREKAHVRYL